MFTEGRRGSRHDREISRGHVRHDREISHGHVRHDREISHGHVWGSHGISHKHGRLSLLFKHDREISRGHPRAPWQFPVTAGDSKGTRDASSITIHHRGPDRRPGERVGRGVRLVELPLNHLVAQRAGGIYIYIYIYYNWLEGL